MGSDAKAKKCEICKDKESKFKQNIKKGLNQFFKCLSENAGKRKLTPIKIKITADFSDADNQAKFPKEKDNGELKAVFDTLSKRKDFHKITTIGATVTYKGKDGKDDPKSFTTGLKSTTIDVLAAAGEAKSKTEDKKSETKGKKSDAKTKDSNAKVEKSQAETETPNADDTESVSEDNTSNAEDKTSKPKDEEPEADTKESEAEVKTPKTKDEKPEAETKESEAKGNESGDAATVGEKSAAKTTKSGDAAAVGEKSAAKTTKSEAEDKKPPAEDKKSEAKVKKSEAKDKKSAASNEKGSRRLLPSEAALLRATRRRLSLPVMAALLNPFHQLQCA